MLCIVVIEGSVLFVRDLSLVVVVVVVVFVGCWLLVVGCWLLSLLLLLLVFVFWTFVAGRSLISICRG